MLSDNDENASVSQESNNELPYAKKDDWTNRERALILCSRGVSYRDRHLMNDLKALMPHAKGESKVDKKQNIVYLNEIAEMKNCSKCLYFEAKKKKDLYLRISNIDGGPSAKFLVQNVHTSGELKMSGNCLKGSRPILSFDSAFDKQAHNELLKELFCQVFNTPNAHPKSQPFFDHVLTFSIEDKRIWIRNYQIVDEATQKLEEIGPRFVLQLIKIFDGSFGGAVLFENADYVCPNTIRRQRRHTAANKYAERVQARQSLVERRQAAPVSFAVDPVFEAVYGSTTALEPDQQQKGDAEASEIVRLKRKIDKTRRIKVDKKRKMKK